MDPKSKPLQLIAYNTIQLPPFTHKGRRGSSNQCYVLMYAITRAFQVKRILEIGTHVGASCITFCQAIRANGDTPEIWTIDPHPHIQLRINLKAAQCLRRVHPLIGTSQEILPDLWKEIGDVDLVFIDGDHSPEAIEKDFHNTKDHAPLILFHDTADNNHNLECVQDDPHWNLINFPTRSREYTGALVGLSLAVKNQQ